MDAPEMLLVGYDVVGFQVGDARQTAHFSRTALKFRSVASAGPESAGPETGVRDRASCVTTTAACTARGSSRPSIRWPRPVRWSTGRGTEHGQARRGGL